MTDSEMQKLALTLFAAIFGAGVGALVAAVIGAGPPGTMLAVVVGSLLWTYFGYGKASKPEGSFWNKLVGMAFAPLVLPVIFLCLMLLFGAAFVIVPPIGFVKWHVREGRLRKRMKSKGRYIPLRDVRRFLEAGRGTLIAEIGLKGKPYRVWFAEDSLSKSGMAALSNDDLIALVSGEERPFNSWVLNEYLNEETGKAFLTRIPPRWASSGRLERMFPYVSIAGVVRPFGPPA